MGLFSHFQKIIYVAVFSLQIVIGGDFRIIDGEKIWLRG